MAKQGLHIALSLILYIGTAGISVHSHYCQSELKDISFWMQAEPCHKAKAQCAQHPPQDEKDNDCCDDKVSFEKVDIELFPSVAISMPDMEFIVIGPTLIEKVAIPPFKEVMGAERYRPPPEKISLHIKYQSFLC